MDRTNRTSKTNKQGIRLIPCGPPELLNDLADMMFGMAQEADTARKLDEDRRNASLIRGFERREPTMAIALHRAGF